MAGGVTGFSVESPITPDALTIHDSMSPKPALISSYKHVAITVQHASINNYTTIPEKCYKCQAACNLWLAMPMRPV